MSDEKIFHGGFERGHALVCADTKDTGFVLCHRIKKLYPDTPVMMVTAVKAATGLSFAADSALQKSWLKADLLLDTPIRAEVLRNDVNGLLNRAAP